MTTIQDCLRESRHLAPLSDTARLDTEVLLAHVLQKDRSYLYTWPEKRLTDEQLYQYQQCLMRRERGEPIAYILGYQEFWSLRLAVNPSTLIPRPETELLVELALELGGDKTSHKKLLDLGTGTGAVALAIASERPAWHITALEKNHDAISLAKSNQRTLHINNVDIIQSDWLTALQPLEHRFHMIVANPPYIDANDEHLSQGDVRFEPSTALVAGQAGLQDIADIILSASAFLESGGFLLLEHGYQQEQAVAQFLSQAGYRQIFCQQDIAGQPRVSGAQWLG